MKCSEFELHVSDFVEGALPSAERDAMDAHLGSCTACRRLIDLTREIVSWGSAFPSHPAPEWLAGRILARTPPVVRERWVDTIRGAARWVLQPRMAMTVFASVIVLGWTLNLNAAQVSQWVREPSLVYYGAQHLAYDAWDDAVRTWYSSRIVTEVHCRIEQLRETTP